MLDGLTTPCFPNNVASLLVMEMANLQDPIPSLEKDRIRVVQRPVRDTDRTQTISVVPAVWVPDMESLEMQGGPSEPSIQRYNIVIEGLVIDTDEARGIATHVLLAAMIRMRVHRSPALREALPLLKVDLLGKQEAFAQWGVAQQRFEATEDNSKKFYYLSSLEFWFTTQINRN